MRELGVVTCLLALAYLANFLALSAVAARQAGRSVWLFGRGPRIQRLTGLAFRVSFAVAFLWPALRLWTGGLGPDDPVTRLLAGWPAALGGHLLVALGALAAALGQIHMGASWRIGAAEGELGALVETGPFALSRNPVFLGQMVLLAGLLLAFPDGLEAAAVALGLGAILVQARIEEAALRATHGAAYEAYAARVPRWIGRVRA